MPDPGNPDTWYSDMVFMVEDWIQKKKLSKLGFSFDSSKLTDFEVACYTIISDKFSDLEIADLERKNKNKGSMA